MKKLLYLLFVLFTTIQLNAQKELVLNTTGYGFDRDGTNGINWQQWEYIQKFTNLTHAGQDASPTAIRLHIEWHQYEPTQGAYQREKIKQAVAAILSLKPYMKVALHFPFQRTGYHIDSYLNRSEVAEDQYDSLVQHTAWTCPSIFSEIAKQRFYAFVDDVLAQLTQYYPKILFVTLGNSIAEEMSVPWHHRYDKGKVTAPGIYDDRALAAWRTEYLPCRYPGQSTVTWNGVTHNIASAPSDTSRYDNWNSDHQREYHRFAAWGLSKLFDGFKAVVKNRSQNLKVLYFVSDFGGLQGNMSHMHNSTLVRGLQNSDGIYTSEGVNKWDNHLKIRALDILKGTAPHKTAVVEYDPEDFGQPQNSNNTNAFIEPGVANEWMPRAFKHGADYICIAMHFFDNPISQLAQPFANIRANFVNGTYQSPARPAATTTVNLFPGVFTEYGLFGEWSQQNGNNWGVTDNTPLSINMIDDGYWQNIWNCSTAPDPCAYTVAATGPTGNVTTNTSITLGSNCTGQCSGLSYSWSGNGISGTNSSITFNAPSTAGSYTYTLTTSKSGCTNKTTNISVNVVASGGSSTCINLSDQCTANQYEIRSYTLNMSTAGAYPLRITYRAHERPSIARMRINNGTWQNFNVAQTGVSQYVEISLGNFNLNSGNNAIDFASGDGLVCYRQLCAQGSGCTPPSAPSLSASPASITSGASSDLTATGCAGTVTWSHALGMGTAKTVSPTTTTTYTATCTVGGCTSSNGSVTVTVTSGGSNPCSLTDKANIGTWNGLNVQARQYTVNGSTTWMIVTAIAGSSVDKHFVRGANFATNGGITWSGGAKSQSCFGGGETGWGGLGFPAGVTVPSGYVQLTEPDGAIYFQQSCTAPSAPSLSASPSTINTGSGSTLSATGCSGGTITWSHGLGTGNSKPVTPTVTTTYTATCTVSQCVSSVASVTVTVNPSGITCNSLQGYFDVVNCDIIAGWIYDASHANDVVYVDLYEGSTLIQGNIAANIFRQDLVDAGKGNGVHGYSINTPATLKNGQPRTLKMKSRDCTNYELIWSPKTITCGSSLTLENIDAEEIAAQKKGLAVFPNPNNGVFETSFFLERGKSATLTVIDLHGRILLKKSVKGQGQHKEKLNLGNKASGTMLVQLHSDKGTELKKINIVR